MERFSKSDLLSFGEPHDQHPEGELIDQAAQLSRKGSASLATYGLD